MAKTQHQTQLTSIRIFGDRYNKFKTDTCKGMSLQKLVNRSLVLYLENEEFKKMIDSTNNLQISGSSY